MLIWQILLQPCQLFGPKIPDLFPGLKSAQYRANGQKYDLYQFIALGSVYAWVRHRPEYLYEAHYVFGLSFHLFFSES